MKEKKGRENWVFHLTACEETTKRQICSGRRTQWMKLKEEILGSCSPKIGEQKMVKGKTMELE